MHLTACSTGKSIQKLPKENQKFQRGYPQFVARHYARIEIQPRKEKETQGLPTGPTTNEASKWYSAPEKTRKRILNWYRSSQEIRFVHSRNSSKASFKSQQNNFRQKPQSDLLTPKVSKFGTISGPFHAKMRELASDAKKGHSQLKIKLT